MASGTFTILNSSQQSPTFTILIFRACNFYRQPHTYPKILLALRAPGPSCYVHGSTFAHARSKRNSQQPSLSDTPPATHLPSCTRPCPPWARPSQSASQSTASLRSSASRSAHVISPSTSTSSVLALGPAVLLAKACAANLLCPPNFAARNEASLASAAALVAALFRPRPGPARPPPRPPRPTAPPLLLADRCGGGGGSEKKRNPSAHCSSRVALGLPLPRQQLCFPPARWDAMWPSST